MEKKLRRKFILVCMISATITLSFIVAGINILNYYEINDRTNNTIERIIDNDGQLKATPTKKNNGNFSDNIEGTNFRQDEEKLNGESPEIQVNNNMGQMFSNAIYFVAYEEKGEYVVENLPASFFSYDIDANEYANEVALFDDVSGQYMEFKYKKATIESRNAIVFLDMSKDKETMWWFFRNSVLFSIAALVLIFITSFFLSKHAIKPIVVAYEKQKEFITNASHELKTPLTVIGANNDILEMNIGKNKWIDSNKSQIKRLTNLIENLISMTKMEEMSDSQKMNINISEMTEEIVQNYKAIAMNDSKDFSYSLEEELWYEGDEKNINQLIYILLDNAFKYSDKGGKIKISTYKKNNQLVIEVYNTTDKITKGDHREYFDRFYRGDKSRNSSKEGYGIGLSLAKSIVELHSGKISARSNDGKSLTIKIVL